jgi:hypothetical protein
MKFLLNCNGVDALTSKLRKAHSAGEEERCDYSQHFVEAEDQEL